jgi:hypothetical protein
MTFPNGRAALPHPVADHFPSAESNFVAVMREVSFYFDK